MHSRHMGLVTVLLISLSLLLVEVVVVVVAVVVVLVVAVVVVVVVFVCHGRGGELGAGAPPSECLVPNQETPSVLILYCII